MSGTPLIATCPAEQSESIAVPMFLVSYGAGNSELHLSTRARITPKLQLGPNSLSPLAHPRYAPMSRSSVVLKNLWVDPLPIIADTHSKVILIITDFHFNMAGSSVGEGIPHHLTGDPVGLILNDRG
jgi:hypothetical protein